MAQRAAMPSPRGLQSSIRVRALITIQQKAPARRLRGSSAGSVVSAGNRVLRNGEEVSPLSSHAVEARLRLIPA